MVGRGLTHVTALALNSTIGLAFLLVVNVLALGPGVVAAVGQSWQWWYVLPGLLGTLAVFAMLFGWTAAGATLPTVTIIAAQIGSAALIDQMRIGPAARPLEPAGWVGIALLVLGAALVMLDRR
jgi:transporter family-2 protein